MANARRKTMALAAASGTARTHSVMLARLDLRARTHDDVNHLRRGTRGNSTHIIANARSCLASRVFSA